MVTGSGPAFQFQTASPSKDRGLRRWIVLGVLAVLVLIGATLWWLWANPVEEGTAEGACFLLIDRTSSVSDAASVDHYQEMADQAIRGCADRSVVMAIGSFDQDGTSVELAANSVNENGTTKEFLLFPGSGRSLEKRQGQVDDNVEAALAAADGILEQSVDKTRGSDLISAIDQAAVVLKQLADKHHDVSDLFLVILSDGIQISDSYTFADFTEDGAVSDYVEAAGVDADLTGVVVNFGGVNSGTSVDGQPLSGWFEDQVEGFWTLYVETAGGRVCEYSADPLNLPVGC